jgi:hypothetical protein
MSATTFSICYICFKLYLSQDELMAHFDAEHKVPGTLENFYLFFTHICIARRVRPKIHLCFGPGSTTGTGTLDESLY